MNFLFRAIAFLLIGTFASPCMVLANEAIQTQPIAQGQLVYPVDINQWPETSRNEAGGAITALMGVQNLLPASNPLAATLSNSTMTFTIGGGGQTIIAQDSTSGGSGNTRYIDSCPTQTITIPANSTGSTRTDLLSIEYNQLATNPHSVPFSNNTTQTVSNALESCLYNYSTATSTPPTNYLAFASVSVPNGATTASQATVTYLFPTVSARITSVLGGFVSSVNGNQGALTAAAGNGLIVSTQSNGFTYTLSTPVSLSNGGNNTGTPSLTPGTNLSSSGSWANQTLNVIANPTFSGLVTGQSGAVFSGSPIVELPAGSSNVNGLEIGNSSSAGGPQFTRIGTIAVCSASGISGTILSIDDLGKGYKLCLDQSGNLGITGSYNGTAALISGAVVAGSATAPSPISGDLEGSRSITTGALRLGGSSANCILDFGVSLSTTDTFGCPVQSTSAITAGSATAPTGPAAGDVQASRSVNTGALILGGTSASASIDYNVNHAGGVTVNVPFYAPSAVFTGAATSPSISKIYFNGSQITSPLIESVSGTTVVGTTTVSLSAPWTVAPQCTGTVSNGTAAHSIAIGATSTTVVQVADGAVDTFNLTCVGH